jgi:PKHD-type hydroxylase
MKRKRIITEDFFLGNLGDLEATKEILDSYHKKIDTKFNEISELDSKGEIGGTDSGYDSKLRKCSVSWMEPSESNFISIGLEKILNNVNSILWNYDLINQWVGCIQFTKYIGRGEHYSWHKDHYEELDGIGENEFRKISIVYCLSKKSDYIGGEFQIKTSKGETYTTKFDFGDFIVFPSNRLHRVKPLKSGTRVTLVGWYR